MSDDPTVGARVNPELNGRIEQYASDHNLKKSDVLRRTIREGLDELEENSVDVEPGYLDYVRHSSLQFFVGLLGGVGGLSSFMIGAVAALLAVISYVDPNTQGAIVPAVIAGVFMVIGVALLGAAVWAAGRCASITETKLREKQRENSNDGDPAAIDATPA